MFYRFIFVIFFLAPAIGESARAQSGAIRALPLYDQCPSLQTGSAELPSIKGIKDPQKRIKAIEELGKSCDSRAAASLIGALQDEDAAVRAAVVESLGRLGDRTAIDPLIDALQDDDWRVRGALGLALASFQVYQSNNATLNQLVNTGDKPVTDEGDLRARCLGILAVNQMRDVRFSRKAIGFLFQFLDHEKPEFRKIAEETAAELKNTRNGYHELIAILKQHNYPGYRRKAAYWLGKYNLEAARPVLTMASIGDADLSVQKVAAEALASMKKP